MTHKDVEFHVEARGIDAQIFKSFDKACGHAVGLAASGKENVRVDVCIWSLEGARAWGGDDAVQEYNEDPDASVFERIEVKTDSKGRVR